jgi:photosystem II stability/assembly factor-like uncharacterized protein
MFDEKRLWGLTLIMASVLLVFQAGFSTAHAQGIKYYNVNYNLYDFHFIDDKTGWACGKSGLLFKTEDAGQTWERMESGVSESIFGIYFFDADQGIFVGEEGLVMATSDGGKHWEKRPTPLDKHLLTVDFYDESHGMAAGDWGKIIATRDGGKTWQNVSLEEDVVLYAVKFTGPEKVWIAGEMGTIFHTVDGGANWEKQEVAPGTFFGIDMDANDNGFVVGIDGTVAQTMNGGITWEVGEITKESLYNVLIGEEVVVVIGDAGTILTLNPEKGRGWQLVETPVELKANWLQAIGKFAGNRFIVAGDNGSIRFIEDEQFIRPGS